jgi:hypothetical protein
MVVCGLTLLFLQNEKMFARRIPEDSHCGFDPNSNEPYKGLLARRNTNTEKVSPVSKQWE